MKRLLILPLLLMLLTSCNKYRIEGTASASRTDLNGRMLYIKYLDDKQQWKSLDSCEIVHGKFSMKGKIDTVVMATLFMDNHSIMPLVVEEGKITVELNGWDSKISGTVLNDKLYTFLEKKNEIDCKVDELSRKHSMMIMDGLSPDQAEELLTKEGKLLMEDMSRLIVSFVTDNVDNVLGFEGFVMLTNSMPYPVITPEVKEILDKVPADFKEKAYVKEFLSVAQKP